MLTKPLAIVVWGMATAWAAIHRCEEASVVSGRTPDALQRSGQQAIPSFKSSGTISVRLQW